jgi:flagellar hook-basal body complex protein FliE
MLSITLLLSLFVGQADPLRAQQWAYLIQHSQKPVVTETSPTAPHPYVQKLQTRNFEEKFNQLILAVEQFSVAYNQTRGQAWPADKAEALRKAMLELQKAEPSLKANR